MMGGMNFLQRPILVLALVASTLTVSGCGQQTTSPSEPAQVQPASAESSTAWRPAPGTEAVVASAVPQAATATEGFFLRPARQFAIHNGAYAQYDAIAVGDVTGDGRADLVASPGSLNQVELFLQKNDGTLAEPLIYRYSTTNNYSHDKQLVLADFNRDNVLDIAASANNEYGEQGLVYVMLSNGQGGLTGRVASTRIGGTPRDWTVLDVNQDSFLDIVGAEHVTDYSFGVECGPYVWVCPRLTIYYGDGGGLFPHSEQILLRQPYNVSDLEANDVNDDGRPDLIFSFHVLGQNGGPSRENDPGRIMVALQMPGGLGPLTDLYPRRLYEPEHVMFADVTGDGIKDSISYTSIRRRELDNTYAAPFELPSYRSDSALAIAADIDGDGYADLINKQLAPTGDGFEKEVVAVYLQRNGQMQSPLFLPTWPFALAYHDGTYAVGDLNGDGCKDFISAARNQGGILVFDGAQCATRLRILPDETGSDIPVN